MSLARRLQKLDAMARSCFDRIIRRTELYRRTESARLAASARAFMANTRAASAERTNAELRERIDAIRDRFCGVRIELSPGPYRRFRVCVEIDAELIERGFIHGADDVLIAHLGDSIGAQVAGELRRANFTRWEDGRAPAPVHQCTWVPESLERAVHDTPIALDARGRP